MIEINAISFFRLICAALTIAANNVLAQSNLNIERYSQLPASADGIGKSYMGREIAAVMGWQGRRGLSAKNVIAKSARTFCWLR